MAALRRYFDGLRCFMRLPGERVDVVMVALATMSFVLLLWITVFQVHGAARHAVVFIDDLVCVVFALEFLWNWQAAGWNWRYPPAYWYEVLGMVPVAGPLLRGLRLVRILVLIGRYHRVGERITRRAFGARPTEALVERLAQTIVAATAVSMQRNRVLLERLLIRSIRNDPSVRRLRHMPFHDSAIRMVAEASCRIMSQAMTDPRTDEFVAEVLRDNMDQVRVRIVAGSFRRRRADAISSDLDQYRERSVVDE